MKDLNNSSVHPFGYKFAIYKMPFSNSNIFSLVFFIVDIVHF